MRRLLAFAAGIAVVMIVRAYQPQAQDPLPDRSEIRDTIRQLAHAAPPAQQAAFADGRVDHLEYRDAVLARIQCLRTRAGDGVEAHGPIPLAGGRLLTWHYRLPRVQVTCFRR